MLGIVLSLPPVQTYLGGYATDQINQQYGTDIKVEQVALTVFGGVKLKKVMIRDHHQDTLIYANRIKTNILSFTKMYSGDLFFGDIRLDGLVFNLKTYKGEKQPNINVFIDKFDSKTPQKTKKKFLLQARNAYFTNSRFILTDEHRAIPKDIDFRKIDASINNFKIYGPDISAKINTMAFADHRGIVVKDMTARFLYTKKNILLEHLELETAHSVIVGDVALLYGEKGLADFNNRVNIKANITDGSISSNDIRYFYKGLGKNRQFSIKTELSGTMNNLYFKKLRLVDDQNSRISGDVLFKNLLGKKGESFYMNGDFSRINSNYSDLTAIMPDVLGKKLPTSLQKLGQFNLSGKFEITPDYLITDFLMTTAIGTVKAELEMQVIGNIDNASYSGHIKMDNFNLGGFITRKDLGIVSFDVDVDGSGFTTKNLNTNVAGKVSKIQYNKYTYSNIVIDGKLQSPFYTGIAIINDPNLFMDFEGKLDVSGRENKYDFHANIDFANLTELNFRKDSISIFKGDIRVNVAGNTLDNLRGSININESSYQNQKDTYLFDDFKLESVFDDAGVRTMTINSPDIIDGKIVGKFYFAELNKMLQNSIGSLYTNYRPNKVKKGQFLRFNFSIYNKIIEVFLPGIEVGTNTFVRGNINSDNDEFKLTFSSPNIKAWDNTFNGIKIDIDNKNPLYNAFVEMDSIRTKYYKVSEFNVINVTMKDTMYVRSEFKGGNKGEDFYNLNLYHTIDEDNNNVVGINKSELKFKDNLWFLNEEELSDNKIVFDKTLKNFDIDNLIMSHENQRMTLAGTLKDNSYKDIDLTFDNVSLSKILPTVDSLRINGNLDGKIHFKQDRNVYQPTSALRIDSLNVNDIALGDLHLDVEGDSDFKKFTINSSLENNKIESFLAEGSFVIENKETYLDMDMRFQEFNIAALSPLGGSVITDIRGLISGSASVSGPVSKPEIYGRLFLEKAGLRVPYLNTDYAFRENSIIDLSENTFIFQNATLIDTKYKTEGTLNGEIRHRNFSKWNLDLAIESRRLLVLNTVDSEEAAYFGTAFIDGRATISGPTNGLFIGVNATSKKGTDIKIPVNNAEATGTKNFMYFLTAKDKYNKEHGIVSSTRNYQGLELMFELDITPEAEIEVILDRETGHGMLGRGYGTLLLEINTLGKFNMTGDFIVDKGSTYNFKYGGLINKSFDVKKNSYISWEGDPLRARLNLEATYSTNANPAVLLDNPSVNRKVPVEVDILITGSLSSPVPDFNINFPTVSSVLKSEIDTKLSDKDIRQTQALTLLATGGFLSSEGVNESAFTRNLVETATGIFDEIFQNPDDKVKLGIDIVSADRTPGNESDGSVGFTISTQINERISVNGKVGVPVGGINESAIVGDVEVQYRVNEDGSMNLRFFNRENDINYLGEGIGYTQGIGVTYEVDFDTFNEFVNRIFKNRKIAKVSPLIDGLPDSEVPDMFNFPQNTEEEKKKPIPVKVTTEAVPVEEE